MSLIVKLILITKKSGVKVSPGGSLPGGEGDGRGLAPWGRGGVRGMLY